MDVLQYIVKISRKLENFLVIGPRYPTLHLSLLIHVFRQDTDLESEFYTFDDTWHDRFKEKHMDKGKWTSSTALDYFIFKKVNSNQLFY